MEGFKEFLESSSIHGLVYISTTRKLVRLLWISVIITGFMGSAVLIQQSFSSWASNPVSTTLETLPITDLDFPNVTVCPPRDSFTSLNPDLVMSRNMSISPTIRNRLYHSVVDVVYEENYKAQNLEFKNFRNNEYKNLYTGIDYMWVPSTDTEGYKQYEFWTTNYNGSFLTPYFREPFDENTFERSMYCGVTIIVSSAISNYSMFVIDIEYDIEKTSFLENIKINFTYKETQAVTEVELDKTKTTFHRFYYNAAHYSKFTISYRRKMTNEYYTWTDKRNTGMKVTWYFSGTEYLQPYYGYATASYNKYFIQIANQIHVKGITKDMENVLEYSRQYKQGKICNAGVVSWHYYYDASITMENTYKDDITEETLEKAADIYFGMVFCPDYDYEIVQFYQNLFASESPEIILKTLARILHVANEKKMTEHYNTAKTFFDKITMMMNLQHRDIAVLTSGASQLGPFQDLKDHQLSLRSNGERWIKVFSHNTSGGLFEDDFEALLKNPADPKANLFSILLVLDTLKIDGKFHLKIAYPELGGSNEWVQTSNPVTDSIIEGYQPISLDFKTDGNSEPWGGLGKCLSSSGAAICDTPTTGLHLMCVGCQYWWPHDGTISAPAPNPAYDVYDDDDYGAYAVNKVELYARIPHSSLRSAEIEELINHPVHITDETSPAAFIPYCAFGDSLIGSDVSQFSEPVCNIFREKIVNGQLCYEANVNQYKEDNKHWEDDLQKGFSFLVDNSDEYDYKNLILRSTSETTEKSYSVYKQTKKGNFLRIYLRTINPVPQVLDGEGHYALSAIKDIKVTDKFVGLGEGVTKCQTMEYKVDCQTRMYREKVLSECNCSPYQLKSYYGAETKTCTPRELDCVKDITVGKNECLDHCVGIITDQEELSSEKNEEAMEQFIAEYEIYKYNGTSLPDAMRDLKFKSNLKFVQISIDTSTFDRITKDQAAKFVDQLSAIGGTMGLLTGFSLISGVEIVYFAGKIFLKLMSGKSCV